MKPERVFLDTNVWFSALYGSNNCLKLVQAHIEEKIQAVISWKVLDELIINLNKKAPRTVPIFKDIITFSPPLVVQDREISSQIETLVDKKDRKIFASAMKAKAKYFVTGNTKDFKVSKLGKITGIRVISPKQAVELFKL